MRSSGAHAKASTRWPARTAAAVGCDATAPVCSTPAWRARVHWPRSRSTGGSSTRARRSPSYCIRCAWQAHRTLKLVRADLAALGVPENNYAGVNMPRTQEIGAAVEFVGCDGLIAPCARWACDNLILFPDRMGMDATLEVVTSEAVDWAAWATAQGMPA